MGEDTRKKPTFTTTIDKGIQEKFKKTCQQQDLTMSQVLELLMQSYIDGKIKIENKLEIKQ